MIEKIGSTNNVDEAACVLAGLMGEENDKIIELAKKNESFYWRGNRVSIYARDEWVELFDSKGKALAGVAVRGSDASLGGEKAPDGYRYTTNKFAEMMGFDNNKGL